MMKSIFDVTIALLSLSLLVPFMFFIGLVIFYDMGWPIIFKQKRPGLNGKPFILYKFRTMIGEIDKNGKEVLEKNRITNLGRILRRLSLDELPSIFNVFKGDMSLVGPRPLLMKYLPLYTKKQYSRHNVKPGITGWAQINGRNSISWEDKFELDIWYIENQSFIFDLKIIFLTIWKVLNKDGIDNSNETTMPPFLGSNEK